MLGGSVVAAGKSLSCNVRPLTMLRLVERALESCNDVLDQGWPAIDKLKEPHFLL